MYRFVSPVYTVKQSIDTNPDKTMNQIAGLSDAFFSGLLRFRHVAFVAVAKLTWRTLLPMSSTAESTQDGTRARTDKHNQNKLCAQRNWQASRIDSFQEVPLQDSFALRGVLDILLSCGCVWSGNPKYIETQLQVRHCPTALARVHLQHGTSRLTSLGTHRPQPCRWLLFAPANHPWSKHSEGKTPEKARPATAYYSIAACYYSIPLPPAASCRTSHRRPGRARSKACAPSA